MKRHGVFIILLALASAALLAGCWGSSKSTSLEVGGGGGVAATATAVGINVCHNCHANTAVGGVRIFDSWAASRHGNLDNSYDAWDNIVEGQSRWWHGIRPYEPEEQEICGVCHDPNEDSLNLAKYAGAGSDPQRWVIGCEGCHGGGSEHYGVGPIGGPKLGRYAKAATAGQSSQYNTCTGCHQDSNPRHSQTYRRIIDTHFDNASRAVGSDIQGYVIRKAENTSCVDCHNPHSANMNGSINRQWKASGHGDFTAEPWKHYQWTAANRRACQRCHTTTGAMNYLNDPATYNPANNVFSWLGDPATDRRSEMLYCYGCHTNYYGGLRNPGAITASYSNGASHAFPDAAGSNVCMACHSGRESGDSIKDSTAGFDNLSFINSHYLAAGGTVFASIGYHFAERDYSIPANDLHDKIGRGLTGNGAVDTSYRNGPCVSCHFDSRDPSRLSPLTRPSDNTLSHTLSPLTRYSDNDLALNPVCINCHSARGPGSNAAITWLGDDSAAESMQGATHRARYQAALEALKVQLGLKGFHFTSSHPYFANTNWLSPGDTDVTGNTTGKNNMGAAFNYNYLIHEEGGVVHNRRYTRRLIYDSIDWIDDGILNYSVAATLNALDDAVAYKASAIAYLLKAQNGDPGDRH